MRSTQKHSQETEASEACPADTESTASRPFRPCPFLVHPRHESSFQQTGTELQSLGELSRKLASCPKRQCLCRTLHCSTRRASSRHHPVCDGLSPIPTVHIPSNDRRSDRKPHRPTSTLQSSFRGR